MKIRRADSREMEILIDIWLRSVRATHLFLTESDIEALLVLVRQGVLANLDLWVWSTDADEPVGFIGLGEASVGALFIAPEWLGRGGGKALIQHARQCLKRPLRVDVNEQNRNAVAFYLALGFRVTGRSEVDDGGRPFPLLHMEEAAAESG